MSTAIFHKESNNPIPIVEPLYINAHLAVMTINTDYQNILQL